MIEKIKSKIQSIPTDAKHLWANHTKVCIAVAVIVVVLIIIQGDYNMPGYGMKKKPMKHGGKVHRNKKGHGGMMVIKISKDKKNKKK